MKTDFSCEAFYYASQSTQDKYATRVFFFLSLFSCNFDDQLNQNFHKFVIWCIWRNTPSESTGLWQLLTVSSAINCLKLRNFNLLTCKKCLAWNLFLNKNKINNQISIFLHIACYWYSAVVCLVSWKSRRNLVGKPVFIKAKKFMLISKFVCLAALWTRAHG